MLEPAEDAEFRRRRTCLKQALAVTERDGAVFVRLGDEDGLLTQRDRFEVVVSHEDYGKIVGKPDLNTIADLATNPPSEEFTSLWVVKVGKKLKIDSASLYEPHIRADGAKKLVK